MPKSIILKHSFSRIPDGSFKSNLGDLIRSAVILECLTENNLWLTDEKGKNILKWFIDPDKILTDSAPLKYFESCIDIIYNLDNFLIKKDAENLYGCEWKGFIPVGDSKVAPENPSVALLEPYKDRELEFSYQQALVEGLGFDWMEQDYPDFRGDIKDKFEIGLNFHAHPKWRSKNWGEENWVKLFELLSEDFNVSWQKGLDNFDEYIEWIASCSAIITQDSLGMHLASALRKNVIALVGPTESNEYHYHRLTQIKPGQRACMPCNSPSCGEDEHCLREIKPDDILSLIKEKFLLGKSNLMLVK